MLAGAGRVMGQNLGVLCVNYRRTDECNHSVQCRPKVLKVSSDGQCFVAREVKKLCRVGNRINICVEMSGKMNSLETACWPICIEPVLCIS